MDRIRNGLYLAWYFATILSAGRTFDLVHRRMARVALVVAVVCWLLSRLPLFRRHSLPRVSWRRLPHSPTASLLRSDR
jgi:hypothetical protein